MSRKIISYLMLFLFWGLLARNPNKKEFADYIGLAKPGDKIIMDQYFIYSVYTIRYDYQDNSGMWNARYFTYVGVFGTFYKIDN